MEFSCEEWVRSEAKVGNELQGRESCCIVSRETLY